MNRLTVLVLSLIVLAGGCGKKQDPKTIAECRSAAAGARDQAQAARDARQPKDAAKAAEWALRCSNLAGEMLKKIPTPADADRAARDEAAEAAREAKLLAELTAEDARLAEMVSSWKAKGYRGARGLAFRAALKSLALAARQADGADWGAVSDSVKQPAEAAADLAGTFTDRKPKPDGTPDWNGIAEDMDAMAAEPPPEMGAVFALALLLAGQNTLALYEIEMLDHNAVAAAPDSHAGYHFLRGVVFSMNGLPRLGVEQVEEAAKLCEDGSWSGPELLGTIHLMIAANHLSQREGRKADLALVRAMQVWPDNPVSVMLTGEKLAADGQYEAAGESLADAAKDTKYAWLAKRLEARAREIRDKKGRAKPLFYDKGLLCDVAIHCLADSAKQQAPKRLKGLITSARGMGKSLLDNLPTKD